MIVKFKGDILKSKGLKTGSRDCKTKPLGWNSEPLRLNMNWDLSGQKMGSWDLIFRGQKMGGLESQLTWIGY